MARAKQSCIDPAALFFHTSQAARVSPSFLRHNKIIPPLSYTACIHALRCLSGDAPEDVFLHFADEEGDPYAVDLAGRLGAYVIGNDSDFVILNADGYQGYIPMVELLWSWKVPGSETDQVEASADGDGWVQTVRKGKKRPVATVDLRLRTGLGVIPSELEVDLDAVPESLPEGLALSFPVYRPEAFAAHLKLSPSLLPLIGAIVGNDYTQSEASGTVRQSFSHLFFPRDLSLPQRVNLVASTLRDLLSGSSPSSKKRIKPVSGIMDLIDGAITKLLLRDPSTLASGERERITEKIVGAALQYAIPPREDGSPALDVSSACTIHVPDVCPLVEMFNHAGENVDVAVREIRHRYLAAYRAGQLSPRTMDILSTGTAWPRLFLENPNMESVAISIGRPIREWIYAILDDAVGIPEVSDGESTIDEDDDELIDVIEDQTDSEMEKEDEKPIPKSEDPLSELELKLQRLQLEQRNARDVSVTSAGSTRPASSVAYLSMSTSRLTSALSTRTGLSGRSRKVVKEHIRRSVRLAEEDVAVSSLASLLARYSDGEDSDGAHDVSLLLQDDEQRLTVFLRIMESDIPEVRALPREQILAVTVIRYIACQMHKRTTQRGSSKDREKERLTKGEVLALLTAFNWTMNSSGPDDELSDRQFRLSREVPHLGEPDAHTMDNPPATETILVEDRHVQHVAQAEGALEAAIHLSEILFLTDRLPHSVHLLSGSRYHSAFSESKRGHPIISFLDEDHASLYQRMMHACVMGLEDVFGDERSGKRTRKAKSTIQSVPSPLDRSHVKGSAYFLLSTVNIA